MTPARYLLPNHPYLNPEGGKTGHWRVDRHSEPYVTRGQCRDENGTFHTIQRVIGDDPNCFDLVQQFSLGQSREPKRGGKGVWSCN